MTTMELNALRGELARTILNIESQDMLYKIQRYLKRNLKKEQGEECEMEYIEKEEILDSIRSGLKEIKERRLTGREGMDAEELLNEL